MPHFTSIPLTSPSKPLLPNSCIDCAQRHTCLPRNMDDDGCNIVNRLVTQRYLLLRGEHLYRTNDPVRNCLYAIHSGQFKTYELTADGEQRVAGFQFAGDFLCLDSIGLQSYRSNAMALSNAVLCEISRSRLNEAAQSYEPLALQLRELLRMQLAQEQTTTLLLANPVDQKISGFLLALPWHRPLHSLNGAVLELSMTRADIGAHLGLADTTVSRTLNRFQRLGYLTLNHRQLTISDAASLSAIAAGATAAPQTMAGARRQKD